MVQPPRGPRVTDLLQEWGRGQPEALADLIPLVYEELRGVAANYLKGERPGHTLQPTALVHEAFLRLMGQKKVAWENRSQFFALASRMMRRVLVDHARRRGAAKRDGQALRVEIPLAVAPDRDPDLITLDDALTRLEQLDPAQARVVELRFFGGLTVEETAEVTGTSPATVKREWQTARAFLRREIGSPA